jgi:gas vesicle protein
MFIAILGAAAAGAAVALLTAPRSGKETRAKISDALNDGRAKITDAVNDGRDKARHLPGAVKTAGTAARNAFVDAMREPAEA